MTVSQIGALLFSPISPCDLLPLGAAEIYRIDVLDLVYLNENGGSTSTLSEIRSVQISIVARTGQVDPGYTNNTFYLNQQGTEIYPASGDSYRRRLLTEQVKCRNLGLE